MTQVSYSRSSDDNITTLEIGYHLHGSLAPAFLYGVEVVYLMTVADPGGGGG